MPVRLRMLLFLLLSSVLLRAGNANDLEKHLDDRFLNKIFMFRNFYGGSHLTFDSNGTLVKGDTTIGYHGCWCAAQLQVDRVEVEKDKVILRGPRITGVYDSKKKEFSELSREASNMRVDKELSKLNLQADIEVDIELDPAQMDEPTITGILEKVFLTRSDDLNSLIPYAWREPDFDPAAHEITEIKNDAASEKENVSAPKPIHTPDPEYSEEALSWSWQGSLVLWVVVDEKGNVALIKFNQCLGMGLDEQAVRAVSQWKFEPARKDGKPVAVHVNVELTFSLG